MRMSDSARLLSTVGTSSWRVDVCVNVYQCMNVCTTRTLYAPWDMCARRRWRAGGKCRSSRWACSSRGAENRAAFDPTSSACLYVCLYACIGYYDPRISNLHEHIQPQSLRLHVNNAHSGHLSYGIVKKQVTGLLHGWSLVITNIHIHTHTCNRIQLYRCRRCDDEVFHFEHHRHFVTHLDDLAGVQAEFLLWKQTGMKYLYLCMYGHLKGYLVVIQDSVHVFDPDSIHRSVKHEPLSLRSVHRSCAVHSRHDTVPVKILSPISN